MTCNAGARWLAANQSACAACDKLWAGIGMWRPAFLAHRPAGGVGLLLTLLQCRCPVLLDAAGTLERKLRLPNSMWRFWSGYWILKLLRWPRCLL